MSIVGTFPGLNNPLKNTVRAPSNPMDKSTVVSIYPIPLKEKKVTLMPGRFNVPAGSYDKPSILVVGPSSWWKEVDENQPLLEIPVHSVLIAESIVNDYCKGLLKCNMQDAMPGLFSIVGEVTLDVIKTKYKALLDKANDNQKRWYTALVKEADTQWSRTNGNPIAISDLMRLAARELGQNTKEWLQDFQATETIRCVACGNMRNPLYPICPVCKTVVDKDKYTKLGLKQAE